MHRVQRQGLTTGTFHNLFTTSFDCEIFRSIGSQGVIWEEIIRNLQSLSLHNVEMRYLQLVGKGSLTSVLIEKIQNIQELFIDGAISLTVGEKGRCILPFQLETTPPIGNRLNEDCFFLEKTKNGQKLVAAVIDGASSQKKISGLEPATGAFHVSHLLALGFSQSDIWKKLSAKNDLTATQILKEMNDWLHEQLDSVEGVISSDVLTLPGAACTLITVDPTTMEGTFAHVADSMLAIEHTSGAIEILTDNKNEHYDTETLELVAHISNERNISFAEAAKDDRVKTQLAQSFIKKINTPDGCGILNGMHELYDHKLTQTGTFSLRGIKRILLMTDGMYGAWMHLPTDMGGKLPKSLFNAIDEAKNSGHTPLTVTARLLQSDPEATKYPRLKTQDDASFLAIDLL